MAIPPYPESVFCWDWDWSTRKSVANGEDAVNGYGIAVGEEGERYECLVGRSVSVESDPDSCVGEMGEVGEVGDPRAPQRSAAH